MATNINNIKYLKSESSISDILSKCNLEDNNSYIFTRSRLFKYLPYYYTTIFIFLLVIWIIFNDNATFSKYFLFSLIIVQILINVVLFLPVFKQQGSILSFSKEGITIINIQNLKKESYEKSIFLLWEDITNFKYKNSIIYKIKFKHKDKTYKYYINLDSKNIYNLETNNFYRNGI